MRNATGRKVSHATIMKFHANVGNIQVFRWSRPTPLAENSFDVTLTMLSIIFIYRGIIRSSITLTSGTLGWTGPADEPQWTLDWSCSILYMPGKQDWISSTCPTWNLMPDSSASFTNCLASSMVLAKRLFDKNVLTFLMARSHSSKW